MSLYISEVEKTIADQQKIIVALFLILGKAVNKLNAVERARLSVTEDEIGRAWIDKKSPVRVVMRMEPTADGLLRRTYDVVMGDLNLEQVRPGFASGKMPIGAVKGVETKSDKPEKSRVFQLE